MKRMKKILAVLLAAIMVMSMGTSVFAEHTSSTDSDGNTIYYESTTGDSGESIVTYYSSSDSIAATSKVTTYTDGTVVTVTYDNEGNEESTTTTYAITITGSASSNHTYSAWQIFAGDIDSTGKVLSNVTWGSSIDNAKISDLVTALTDSTTVIVPAVTDDNGDETTAAKTLSTILSGISYNEKDPDASAAAIAKALSDFISADETKSYADTLAQVLASILGTAADESSNDSDGFKYLQTATSTTNTSTEVTSSDETTYTYTISGLSAGYYLVTDALTSSGENDVKENDVVARYALQVVSSVSLNTKATTAPTVTKVIDEGTSTTTYNSASEGDTISYVITATLPDISDYTSYALTANDTLSRGLTLTYTKNDSNKYESGITVYYVTTGSYTYDTNNNYSDASAVYTYTLDSSCYTVTVTENDDGTTAITVAVANVKNLSYTALTVTYKDSSDESHDDVQNLTNVTDKTIDSASLKSNDQIVITYDATLNEDAVSSHDATTGYDGNTNTVSLTYSNNPNSTSDTGTTTTTTTNTYTTNVIVSKVDQEEKALSGASFSIYKHVEEYSSEKDYSSYSSSTNPVYYYYIDGEFVKISDYDSSTDGTPTAIYIFVETVATKADNEETPTAYLAAFNNLGEGTYVIVESVTPDGYNTATPVLVTIKANYDQTSGTLSSWTVTYRDVDSTTEATTITEDSTTSGETTTYSGTYTFKIKNQKGSTLPTTGGIGTTIFYVVGAILVLGAAVILVTRRRMANR